MTEKHGSQVRTHDSIKRQPVLFLGHGSPMNAIQQNTFTRSLGDLGRTLGHPKAILCVSAHWMTKGTWVTRMPKPKTIHDFYGFPKPLFDVQYPASGSPEIADMIHGEIKDPEVRTDGTDWGLDHGTWSVLRHMYPKADVPVLQLSIDMSQGPEYHFQLGQKLRSFRDRGILIVGSGNIVHNLRQIDFSPSAKPFDWAIEFDEWTKNQLLLGACASLINQATAS